MGSPMSRPSFDHADSFRKTYARRVGGVKAGYAGYIPGSLYHQGSSHWGGLPQKHHEYRDHPRPTTPRARVPMAPRTAPAVALYTEPPTPPPSQYATPPNSSRLNGGLPPGYAGHQRGSRDAKDRFIHRNVKAYVERRRGGARPWTAGGGVSHKSPRSLPAAGIPTDPFRGALYLHDARTTSLWDAYHAQRPHTLESVLNTAERPRWRSPQPSRWGPDDHRWAAMGCEGRTPRSTKAHLQNAFDEVAEVRQSV